MRTEAMVTEHIQEWEAACDVQHGFMQYPVSGMDTVDYSARCRQVEAVGGDCYDFVPLSDQRLALAVGDASGKGLAGALMISNVQSSLRTAALFTGDNGAAAIQAVNRQVHATSLADRYATLFYGVFDGTARTLRYVNAGHNPPLVLRRDGSIHWLETGGAPVGMFPDWNYEQGTVELNSGDIVMAYTDGVTEAVNPSGEQWGVEGVRKAVVENRGRCADDMVHAIFESLDEFTQGGQNDDATVAVLRIQ